MFIAVAGNIAACSINQIDSPQASESLKSEGNKLLIPNKDNIIKEITIFNSDGKLKKQFNSFESDEKNIYLNVFFINQGVYFVSVSFSNGNSVNYKFMKGE